MFWRWGHHSLRADEGGEASNSTGSIRTVSAAPDRGTPSPVTSSGTSNVSSRLQQISQYAWFQKRPFAVTRESDAYQWTAEDGKDTNIIRRLAHNDLELQRMVDENPRLFRRQLVYRTETAAALIERAKLSGEPVRRMTLPGLDGQQLEFEITKVELNPSGLQGAFGGRIAGRADSFITFAFKGGREAFTIISPSDGLYLQADPREPGEVVVKSIDPETYVPGVCGTP